MLKCDRCGGVFGESNTQRAGLQCPVWYCGGTLEEVQSVVKCGTCGNVYGSPPLRAGGTCPGPEGGSERRLGSAVCGGRLHTFMTPFVPLTKRTR